MIPIPTIQEIVCRETGLEESQLLSKRKPLRIAVPRMVCMAIAREQGHSYTAIGEAFNRCHATAINAFASRERSHLAPLMSRVRRLLAQLPDSAHVQKYMAPTKFKQGFSTQWRKK